jgi:hypothetical protein
LALTCIGAITEALPKGAMVLRMPSDYAVLRDQARGLQVNI